MKRLDIELIVKDVLSEIKNIKKHHAKIIVENLMSAFGDRMLIHQVFMNLLSNAVKYSAKKKSPEIRVGSFKEQEECVFYIKDNGTGFSMDHVEQIFGVFQRLHNEADYEGTGIGLAIVQRIIIKHGGRVWAEGKPNEGAVFYFTLPQNIL
jgi:light-regulated signal transduction histidine kinase (bacteriophytochrome)